MFLRLKNLILTIAVTLASQVYATDVEHLKHLEYELRLEACAKVLGENPAAMFFYLNRDNPVGLSFLLSNIEKVTSKQAYDMISISFEYASNKYSSAAKENKKYYRGVMANAINLLLSPEAVKIDSSMSYVANYLKFGFKSGIVKDEIILLTLEIIADLDKVPYTISPFLELVREEIKPYAAKSAVGTRQLELLDQIAAKISRPLPGYTGLKNDIMSNRDNLAQLKPMIQNVIRIYSGEIEGGDLLVALFYRTRRTEVRQYVADSVPTGMPIGNLNQQNLRETALHDPSSEKRLLAETIFLKSITQ
jgi:hypothetical protein